jgi:hypothetical protein
MCGLAAGPDGFGLPDPIAGCADPGFQEILCGLSKRCETVGAWHCGQARYLHVIRHDHAALDTT